MSFKVNVRLEKGSNLMKIRLSAPMEHNSEHPLSEIAVRVALERKLEMPLNSDYNAIPGHGSNTSLNGKKLMWGNRR